MKNLGRFYDLTNGGQAQGAGSSSSIVNNPNEYQTAVVYDLISEGPIQGLVNGTDSIYLDQTAATIGSIGTKHNIAESLDVSFTASSLTVVDNVGSMFSGLSVNDGDRFINIAGAKKAITGGLSMTKGSNTVTASSSFFNANDLYIPGTVDGMKQFVTVKGAGVNGGVLRSEVIAFTSATSVQLALPASTTVSSADGTVDKVGKIASITNTTTAVISNISAQGTDARNVSNVTAFTTTPKLNITDAPIYNHGAFQYAFMNGYRSQPLLQSFPGVGSASIVHSANTEIQQTDLSSITGSQSNVTSGGYTTASGNATASATTISASTMGISNQPEIDKLKLTFKFPMMLASKKSSGDEAPAHVELRIFLGFKRAGDSSFTEVQIFGPTNSQISGRPTGRRTSNFRGRLGMNTGFVEAETKAPFIETFTINMEEFQPFSDFQVKVERVNPTNARHGDYDHTNPCTLQTIEAIVDDKLSYPLSAYGALIFDAQSFGKLPVRGYEVRGRLLQVPTNYFPRTEGNRSVAGYDRNVSTGVDENSYQQWDGNFRGDKSTFNGAHVNHQPVYTDNPAWVFYDLVTNDRYGVGKYLDASQIDKYELFRIARYCDELVSDGEGGTEPRFTCNLYLSQAAEALKVLKDVTSIFRGMMFWLNGEIQFSQNRFQSPVYTFSKANVIAGKFAYTSTKSQYRSNQVRVTWNDPDSMYKKAVEIVEDTNNILETGKIVSKDVVAFGCTSKGQAHRFGKWTLLSEIMETEGISFETSFNGGFLKPGDVVNVQDADRDHIRFSGRTSSSNSTTVINVDSAINLSSGNTFQLSIVYPSGGAFLGQESATINSVSYIRGDYIPQATVGGSLVTLDTSAEVANAVDDSGNVLVLNWNPNSRVETKTISSTGSSVTAIQVSSAFSSAPAQDMPWAIKEIKADGALDDGSAKQYLITGVNESSKGRYEIIGIKYEPSKFDLVDRGYKLQQDQTIRALPSYTDEVPVPKSVTLSLKQDINPSVEDATSVTGTAKIIRLQWQHPTSIRTDSSGNAVNSIYEHLNYYEIEHNASGRPVYEKIFATKDTSFIDIPLTSYGVFTFRIRTINTEQMKSAVVQKSIEVGNQQALPSPTQIGRLFPGGSLNAGLSIDSSSGVATISSSTYTFFSRNEEEFILSGTGTGNTQQAFSGMGASAEAYLLFDADATSDHLKAVELKTDTAAQDADGNAFNFEYFAEVGAANAGISSASGTVTIENEEGTVTGSSTSFLSDYNVGDLFIVGAAGSTRFMARINRITSDTSLELDTVVPRAYSGTSIFKQSFKPDVVRDTIIAKVITSSGTVYTFEIIYSLTAGVVGADGADGPKTLTHFVYHQASSANAPATPSASSYTFSTNSFSGLTSGWATTPPTFAAGNANKYWYSYFTATENTAGGDTASGSNLSFQASQQGIGFSGLVTFSSSNLTDGSTTYNPATVVNAGVTTIDGGKITANTITANQIAAGEISLTSNLIAGTLPAGSGGTGLTSIASLTNSQISISSSGVLSGAGGGTVSASALGANTDSTATILSGNLTGSVAGTAASTVKSGAASGATANQDSTASIRAGTTLGNISGTTLSAGKIKLTSSTFSLDTSSTISSNAILIEANSSSGARIIIAD
tara:strand:+ start:4806 stop:9683 length:4878 start_codon:yes stop_codon:yes gene_type:complete